MKQLKRILATAQLICRTCRRALVSWVYPVWFAYVRYSVQFYLQLVSYFLTLFRTNVSDILPCVSALDQVERSLWDSDSDLLGAGACNWRRVVWQVTFIRNWFYSKLFFKAWFPRSTVFSVRIHKWNIRINLVVWKLQHPKIIHRLISYAASMVVTDYHLVINHKET